MHLVVGIIVGVAIGLAWAATWALVMHAFGFRVFRGSEDRDARRERMKRFGKARYILVFGVLGYGVSIGLGVTVAGLVSGDTHGWEYALAKFAIFSLLGGLFHGARTWNINFRDPVPFPPWPTVKQ